MHDELTFDARFADAFDRYLADAPVDVDAVAVAAAAVADAGRRRGLVDRLPRPTWIGHAYRGVLVAATLGLLLVAAAASLLLIGSFVNQPTPGGSHLLLTNGALDCQDLVRFGTGDSEQILECVDRLVIAPDGTRAAARGASGIDIIDLADGSIDELAGPAGPFTIPVAWSPRGTWLHWVSCDESTEGCRGFIGQPGSDVANEIPEPGSGYNGSFLWSQGETAFLFSTEEQLFLGGGDGGDLRPVRDLEGPLLAIAPDGGSFAVSVGEQLGGGELARSDVFLQDADGPTRTRLTQNESGRFVTCAAWSPDATRLAVVVAHRGTIASPEPEPTAQVVIVTPAGTVEQRWSVPAAIHLECEYFLGRMPSLTWSPDGTRLLLVAARVANNPARDPVVVTVANGTVVTLAGLERAAFSPDGDVIAALGNVGAGNPDDVARPATVELVELETATRRSLGSVTVGPWSTLAWAP